MVAALNHSMNGITRWVIPIASAFASIMCHVLEGKNNGDNITGCTRYRGAIKVRGTETLSVLVLYSAKLGLPAAPISTSRGASTSLGVGHLGRMTNVAGNRPRRMSREKARIFLSSGIGLENYGVTNWVPQSTLMCGSGESRHTTTGGLSPNGKVT